MTGAARSAVPAAATVAAGAALVAVCYGFARFAYGLFAPELQAEFDLSDTWSAVIGAGGYVGYCVAILVSTWLTPRWGPRRVASLAGAVATVGMAGVAVAPSATALAVALLVAGSSTGIASPPLAAAVEQCVRRARRDRAQTLVNAGTGFGVLLSGPVALLLSAQWRLAWLVYAGGAAVVTWWVRRTVPGRDPRDGATIPARTRGGHDVALLVASFTLGVGSVAVWTSGRSIVEAGTPGDDAIGALVWVVIGAAGIAGALSGPLVQRIGVARSWALLMVLLAGATAVIGSAPSHRSAVLVAAAAFGAAYIALTGVALVWATRRYPRRTEQGVGASFFLIALGQAIGALVVGVVVDLLGLAAAFHVCAAVALLGALTPARAAMVGRAAVRP